jgi:hypothetical protein
VLRAALERRWANAAATMGTVITRGASASSKIVVGVRVTIHFLRCSRLRDGLIEPSANPFNHLQLKIVPSLLVDACANVTSEIRQKLSIGQSKINERHLGQNGISLTFQILSR